MLKLWMFFLNIFAALVERRDYNTIQKKWMSCIAKNDLKKMLVFFDKEQVIDLSLQYKDMKSALRKFNEFCKDTYDFLSLNDDIQENLKNYLGIIKQVRLNYNLRINFWDQKQTYALRNIFYFIQLCLELIEQSLTKKGDDYIENSLVHLKIFQKVSKLQLEKVIKIRKKLKYIRVLLLSEKYNVNNYYSLDTINYIMNLNHSGLGKKEYKHILGFTKKISDLCLKFPTTWDKLNEIDFSQEISMQPEDDSSGDKIYVKSEMKPYLLPKIPFINDEIEIISTFKNFQTVFKEYIMKDESVS